MTVFAQKDGGLHVEGAALTDIAARFGTSCYVYSRVALEASLAEFQNEIAGIDALVGSLKPAQRRPAAERTYWNAWGHVRA